MLGLILRALASRRAATLTLLALTVLAAGAAAAAPQYVTSAMRDLAVARASSAPLEQRTLAVQTRLRDATLSVEQFEAFHADVAAALDLPSLTTVAGLQIAGTANGSNGSTSSGLFFRDDVCAHLRIDGACPARVGEVVLSPVTARALGVEEGDEFEYSLPGAHPVTVTVAGLYRPDDPYSAYWAGRRMVGVGSAGDAGSTGRAEAAGIFTTAETIVAGRPRDVGATVDAVAGPDVFARTPPLEVRDRIDDAQAELLNAGYESQGRLRAFAIATHNSQIDIVRSVPVSVFELLAVCWVALYLAVRHGAQERRRDIGLLKLRGAGRGRMLLLAIGQSALPMLAGGLLGLAAALPLRPAAGTVAPGTARQADLLSLAAVALTVLGALVAAAVAERRALTAPVALLMRAVPPRRTGWRYGTVDAVLVAVALAGAYEARAFVARDETATWLALLTPALLAVALGVLLARLVVPIAARVGHAALRSGRLGLAVTATELARRPAVPRLTALLTAAVALLATAAAAADTIARAGGDRASIEVGADRVLLVTATSRSQLLAAVRAADPDGRSAMAVVASPSSGVLAVDAPRLAAVARWRAEYGGPDPAAVADRLRAGAVPGDEPAVTGETLTLDATGTEGRPVVEITFADARGGEVVAEFGPISGPRRAYEQDVPACAEGCRLVAVALADLSPGAVVLHSVRGAGGGVDVAVLGDRMRWRTGYGAGEVPMGVTAGPDGLALTYDEVSEDPHLFLDDAAARLPAIATGAQGDGLSAADPHLTAFPGVAVPVEVIGGAAALPRLGGAGVLVDLETADLMAADFGGGDSLQVWLTGDAPADLPDRLEKAGIAIIGSTTSDGVAAQYGRQAAPVTVRFQLGIAVLALLLAAGALGVVVAVERRPRTAELVALRRQGLGAAAARRAALGGYAVVVVLAVAAGLVTAVLARTVLAVPTPLFPDDWTVLAAPPGAHWRPLSLATVAALLVFGGAVLIAAGRLTARVRRLTEEGP